MTPANGSISNSRPPLSKNTPDKRKPPEGTGDEDLIAATLPLTEKFRNSLNTVIALNTEYQNEVAPLLVSFGKY